MKAAYITSNGGPEMFRYGDLPDPVPGPGDVLVDIHAASVNAADWKSRVGGSEYDALPSFPHILGRDFSGVVAALGEGVDDLAVGDAVWGVCIPRVDGAYAEKIAFKAELVARKPSSLTHVETAAVALAGLTAMVGLEDTLELKAGETILIQGGAGGVASMAIQMAKHIGARVVTTASPANHDYVRGLGADQVIDYTTTDFTEVLSDLDAVYDTVGGDVAMRSFQVLRPGGRAAFIASGPQAPAAPRDDVASLRPKVDRTRARLERVLDYVASGAVKIPEIRTFALAEAAKAHVISQGRHFRGKLVLKVR